MFIRVEPYRVEITAEGVKRIGQVPRMSQAEHDRLDALLADPDERERQLSKARDYGAADRD